MNDGYRKLMFRSLKDARDIVAEYNEWDEEVFEQQAPVPPQAVPQIAMMLYRSRIQARISGDHFEFPDYDGKMYE